jgi:hypothetical protein
MLPSVQPNFCRNHVRFEVSMVFHLIAKWINSFLCYTISKHLIFVFISDSSRSRVVSLSIVSNGEVGEVEVDPFISLC